LGKLLTRPIDADLHGRSVAVVLSRAAYDRLSGQQASLRDVMQASPLAGLDEDLVFERDTSRSEGARLLGDASAQFTHREAVQRAH
jgi:hypothetical protein